MNIIEQEFAEELRTFHLPKYEQLPDIGLYLEQTVQYINHCLRPLGCMEITGAMIRNYVKMGLAPNPVQKRYYRKHLAHLISVAILKNVLPLEDIAELFHLQQATYSVEVAYNYFGEELENILWFQFGLKDTVDTIGTTSTLVKKMLRSAIIAVSHIIYLNVCLRQIPSSLDLS